MTAETFEVPTQPRAAAQPAAAVPVAAVPAATLWRRALLRALLAPLPVLAPLVALAPTEDQRFTVYRHGAMVDVIAAPTELSGD